MLRGDTHMGVTLQTLHETSFDHGVILSQTPRPGIWTGEEASLGAVNREMAVEGARLLLAGLRRGDHVPPYVETTGVLRGARQPLQHAPKMSKADTRVDWAGWTADDWRRRLRINKAVWTMVGVPRAAQQRRVIFHDASEVRENEVTGLRGTIQVYSPRPLAGEAERGHKAEKKDEGGKEEVEEETSTRVISLDAGTGDVFIQLADGHSWIRCQRAKMEGKPERAAVASLKGLVSLDEE